MPADDFNRADGGLGADWTTLVGTWAIVSNQAEVNDDDGATGYYARFDGTGADVGSSDMWAEVVTNSTQTNGSSNTGPGVRHRSAALTGYQFTTNLNDSCGLWRINAGSETGPLTTFTTPVAAGDTVRLEAVGRTFRFKVNGSLVNLFTDTNIADGQRGVMNGYNNVGTDVVRIDRFATGPLTDLTAPYVADWSAQVTGTGANLTPTIPAQITAGDCVVAIATTRNAGNTIAAPTGEGWADQETPSQTGLKSLVTAKIWGLGGQTDDTTPTFTNTGGANGWGVTVLVIRNPDHANNPWTSVADAIVAKGSQSNASSTTVTAPSVDHVGDHVSVLRLFASADDNALGSPSAGVLIFGGAAYDQTTGDDYAQAASILEDQSLSSNTGTSTVTETVVGPDISNGITLVLAIPSGSAVTGIGEVTGTGAIAGTGIRGVVGGGNVTGSGLIAGVGTRGVSGAGDVAGTGALAGVGQRGLTGIGDVTGTGAVSASGARGVSGTGSVPGTGSLAALGTVGRSGAATATGAGTVTGVGVRGVTGTGSVSGAGAIDAAGIVTTGGEGSGQVTGTGTIAAIGTREVTGASTVSIVGAIVGAGHRSVIGLGNVAGAGQVTGRGSGVGADVGSQGTWDTGRRRLVYDATAERTYRTGRRLVYDR